MAQIVGSRESDVWGSLDRVGRLLRRGVLAGDMAATDEGEGIFTLVLIYLADALAYFRIKGFLVDFIEGTEPEGDSHKTLIDFVLRYRNMVCHISCEDRSIDEQGRLVYGVIRGNDAPRPLGDLVMSCDYADDVAFFFGSNRIYLKRHIEHAYWAAVEYSEKLGWAQQPSKVFRALQGR